MKPSSDALKSVVERVYLYRISQRRVKGDVMCVLYREQTLGTLIQAPGSVQKRDRERGNQTERENNPDGGNPDPRGEATAGSAPEEGLGITGETTPENIHPLLRTCQQVVEI
ncbi:hypothetical protein G5714_009575 [Onychostoma macrolepis]|uniref:Uncharacterized protein n=1 Tax=Onychostoma macrolepis TaxID=369639 RepID=A0A7J6CUV3_9TELE|nr:hypothetical protein G5714_009575 [Onychostoma macrolepis]